MGMQKEYNEDHEVAVEKIAQYYRIFKQTVYSFDVILLNIHAFSCDERDINQLYPGRIFSGRNAITLYTKDLKTLTKHVMRNYI